MPELDSKDKDIFVRLDNPIEFRTIILESARLSTLMLKNKDKLIQIKKQKKKEKFKLNIVMSEARSLINTLELKNIDSSESKESKKTIKFSSQKNPKLNSSEKDKLTQDLEEIERRLNSLKF